MVGRDQLELVGLLLGDVEVAAEQRQLGQGAEDRDVALISSCALV